MLVINGRRQSLFHNACTFIEPDIVDSSDENEDRVVTITKGSHSLPLTIVPMKTTSSLQIRPIQALKPDPPEVPPKPTQTYTCSFCNGKQSSQESLLQHLNQHVNFGGALPSKSGKLCKKCHNF